MSSVKEAMTELLLGSLTIVPTTKSYASWPMHAWFSGLSDADNQRTVSDDEIKRMIELWRK